MHPSSRFTLTTVFSLLLLFVVGFALLNFGRVPVHAAGASVSLSLSYGPPTSSIVASGKGFKSREIVTLFFDTTQVGTATASTKGSISSKITVPASATPGNHFVQAKGKSSGLFAQATFLVQTDWVQSGFNREHTGFNVFENVLNTGNVSRLTQSWLFNSYYWGGMGAVANGVIYLRCNQTYLCALSATTGQLLWNYNTNEQFTAMPAIANNLVYIDTAGGHIDALNATSGTLVWSYTTGFTITDAPLIANGLVYVGASNGVLYTLNGITGQAIWKHTFQSIFSTPSIDGGLLYVSAGGSLYALKSQTGQIAWYVSAKGGTPVIANGMIYLNDTADGKLLALNEQTGALVWSGGTSSNPAVANGVVYVTSTSCTLEALSATTGAVLWQYYSFYDYYTCIVGTPVVANGVIFVGGSDSSAPDCYCTAVYAFSTITGVPAGYIERDNGDAVSADNPIVVVNGTLYFSAADGLNAYHL